MQLQNNSWGRGDPAGRPQNLAEAVGEPRLAPTARSIFARLTCTYLCVYVVMFQFYFDRFGENHFQAITQIWDCSLKARG